ncbi:MAG TPA: hypothetical protein VFP97_13880, partial [Chitinophagaceae bacterium]|nr:hypothetical protein [Chitinophagaceae bacterium]
LTFGTFFSAKKYVKNIFNFNAFVTSIKSVTLATCFENTSYFLLRNFITFFTTIEILILALKNRVAERDVFAEGMRLSGLLVPFALFYINFNVNQIKKRYYKIITLISILLLFVSPLYVLLFYGEQFSNKIYFYNFFIAVFAFIAFLEKDYIEFLTRDNSKKKRLLLFNYVYFGTSVLLFILLLQAAVSIETIILVFSAKLMVYYSLLLTRFNLPVSYKEILAIFMVLPALNYILARTGYYSTAFHYLVNLKNHIL